MVEFEEPALDPKMSSDPKETSGFFESPTHTAVNTAVPSRAPSVSIEGEDIEDGTAAEKRASQARHEALGCVDPVTHIVGWNGPDDPENPMNWSRAKKWRITMVTAMMTFCVSFASSVFSTATQVTAVEFGVSLEVMILGVSLYVLGFACGTYIFPS
jgi:DHA1 family multidrug resistance protein-like MFS transporter